MFVGLRYTVARSRSAAPQEAEESFAENVKEDTEAMRTSTVQQAFVLSVRG